MEQLSSHLAANLAELNARFGRSADFYAKELELYHCKGAIVLFDGMASLKGLWQLLLDAASRRTPPGPAEQLTGEQVFALLFEHSALPAEPAPVENWDALIRRLTAGMAVLLLDGCAKGIAFSVQSLNARSVDEPAGEGNLRGSREGFADLLRVNTSLLRRCFRNDALVIEIGQADCEMKTEYALCYCRDTADPKAVQKVRQTLQRARPQLLLDSSYFVPWLFPCKIRTFAPVRYTERPIVAAAKLREGKFVILVNGSPSALILPTLFCENFECLDDYAGHAWPTPRRQCGRGALRAAALDIAAPRDAAHRRRCIRPSAAHGTAGGYLRRHRWSDAPPGGRGKSLSLIFSLVDCARMQ